jgi:hypothetical protein
MGKRNWLDGPRSALVMTGLCAVAVGCGPTAPPKTTPSQSSSASVPAEPEETGKGQTAVADPSATDPLPAGTDAGQPAFGAEPAQEERFAPPPLFEGWPEPVLALLISGQQLGYIEPCGCTGLENQKGGLARRYTFLQQLRRERGWEVVPLDAGNQVRRYGKQSEIKFRRTAEGLRSMGYQAVALGAEDLVLSSGDLLAAAKPDDQPSIFTAANVAIFSREYTPRWRVVEAAGKKIGVVAVLGDSQVKKLQGDDILREPALDSLKKAAEEVQAAGCDLYVLLAHATLDESRQLACDVPIFHLVVSAGGIGEPTYEMEKIEGSKSQMVQTGTKGMYVGVVGFFDDPRVPLRYQRVPLDSRFGDAPAMLKLLADYQEELRQAGLEGLGLTEQPHPSGYRFVGSDKCGECHTKAYAVWEKTPHAHATDSIVTPTTGRGNIPRHYDPECLSCHVTGWEPQKIFPFVSGYLSLEKTPHVKQNGCENCHGPGSAHVAAEEAGDDEATMQKLRGQMRLPLAGGVAEKKCLECHDLDNSPDFHVRGAFEKYWKQVEHVGKD